MLGLKLFSFISLYIVDAHRMQENSGTASLVLTTTSNCNRRSGFIAENFLLLLKLNRKIEFHHSTQSSSISPCAKYNFKFEMQHHDNWWLFPPHLVVALILVQIIGIVLYAGR